MRSRFDEQLLVLNKKMIEMGAKCESIIALSANAYDEAREKGLRAGMDEYLTKPINARELNDCLKTLIVH